RPWPTQKGMESAVPDVRRNVVKRGARRIGGVGRVPAATRRPPQKKAVDRAEGQLAALRSAPGARHVIENPGDLGGGEIGVEQEPRLAPHWLLGAGGFERGTVGRGAPVLPDDGAGNRLAARALPDHRRLALVGDAE